MILSVLDPSHGGYVPTDRQQYYEAASTGSASSTQESVFSDASEISSQSSNGDSDHELSFSARAERKLLSLSRCAVDKDPCPAPSFAEPCLPAEQRQHPRRSSSACKQPPQLPRQDERKVLFVNDLVDSATSMVEVIWPLSTSSVCDAPSASGRGVLPLRRYIEETLRRSRTSYSTLQVALYYLILLRPHLPNHNFTSEQSFDCPGYRALQCGRRMFLAALILASKYLQDRNYSSKAWSKMSGLKTSEINGNERCFLQAVQWKLHIPDCIFKRWTDVVLRFTAPPTAPPPGQAMPLWNNKALWKHVIPLLTPELDDPRIAGTGEQERQRPSLADSTAFIVPSSASAGSCATPSAQESIPTPSTILPHGPGPKRDFAPPTPALARMGPLPTPQMTPSSVASNTPAVSGCGFRRPSISMSMAMAMAQAKNSQTSRVTLDRFPGSAASRCSSLAPSVRSSGSSPESMISDVPRSSRSSSISSVSTASTSAPNQAISLRLATSRQVGMVLAGFDASTQKVDEGTAARPITIVDESDFAASPDLSSFSIVDREDKAPSTCPVGSRKRCRPTSSYASGLQDKVRSLLHRGDADMTEVVQDDKVTSTVSSCALRRAMQSLARSSSNAVETAAATRAAQPPCSLRKSGSFRLPVCKDVGRKRTCCTSQARQEMPRSSQEDEQLTELFMEIQPGSWKSVS